MDFEQMVKCSAQLQPTAEQLTNHQAEALKVLFQNRQDSISTDNSKLDPALGAYRQIERVAEDSDESDDEGADAEDLFPMESHESAVYALSEDIELHLTTLTLEDEMESSEGPRYIALDDPASINLIPRSMIELEEESMAFPDEDDPIPDNLLDNYQSESEMEDNDDAKSIVFTATESEYESDLPSGSEFDMDVDDDVETSSNRDISLNSDGRESEEDLLPPKRFRRRTNQALWRIVDEEQDEDEDEDMSTTNTGNSGRELSVSGASAFKLSPITGKPFLEMWVEIPQLGHTRSAPLAKEELVTTRTLEHIDVKINTRYRLLICMRCKEGVLLSELHTHLTKPLRKIRYQADSHRPEYGRTEFEEIPHNLKLNISEKKLLERIKGEFKALFGEEAELFDWDGHYKLWPANSCAYPLDGQVGPVKGIRFIERGVVCLVCDGPHPHCSLSVGSMRTIRRNNHRGCRDDGRGYFKIAPIQSLCGGNYTANFPVPGGLDSVPSLQKTVASAESKLEPVLDDDDSEVTWDKVIRKDVEKSLGTSSTIATMNIFDQKTLIPFLRDQRVHEFVSQWPRDECLALCSPVGHSKAPTPLRRLTQAATETFLADCRMALRMHPAVRRLIMHCNPSSKRRPKAFSVPALRKSKADYISMEVNFLWCCLLAMDRQSPCITFNDHQLDALGTLHTCLHQKKSSYRKSETIAAMTAVFDVLYFPEDNTDLAEDPFASPLMVFLAFLWLRPQGGYEIAWSIPPKLSKVQFSMRLRAARHLKRTLERYMEDKRNGKKPEPWFETVAKPFCEMALQEDNLGPFSVVRDWMHVLTAYCMGHSRPYTVQWNKDELLIFNYKITRDTFTAFIREQLAKLEAIIQSDVLFGIRLESIGVNCDIQTTMDTGDLQKPGWGPFLPEAHPSLINNDSNKFLRTLATMDSDQAPVRRVHDGLVWDRSKSGRWLMQIDRAWQLTYALIHCTGGLPGRATEELLYQWTNEEHGSPTNIRIRANTVALDTTYHKGVMLTGMHKNIVRLLPYRLSRLLFILLRVVRPVELSPVLKFWTPLGEEFAAPVARLYQARLFVSWGKTWEHTRMSAILKVWFEEGVQVPMGIRIYRHFATALQRRYIKCITHVDPQDIQAVADAQAGRSTNVSQAVYAVEKNPATSDERIRQFELLSAYWHEMLGIDTYGVLAKP
ncbi:hypothetical protein HWV62_1727 [Athelia sp. TMB]|nr:hypothetical protein HWV62_1727 [Athelia sp. TMB]